MDMCVAEAENELAICRADLEDMTAAYKAERARQSRQHRLKRSELKRGIRRLADLVEIMRSMPDPVRVMAEERVILEASNRNLSSLLIDGEAKDEQVEARPRTSKLRRLSRFPIDGEGMGFEAMPEPVGLLEAEPVGKGEDEAEPVGIGIEAEPVGMGFEEGPVGTGFEAEPVGKGEDEAMGFEE